jgi:predicted histidine transporter YuiF (NhaC family)
MDFTTEIARQGLGYLLFSGSLVVIFFMYRENRQLNVDKVDLANKRVEDLKQAQAAQNAISESATKVAENTYTIVQNLQQLLNNAKKV